ncbi:MAG: hypothetical protein EOP85_03215 [Verrucomicrobiaceae bacterium]|nr:MAG: hypothetical protein EOP85_03215 [Verrucomicrobiaceae bacterium]
MYPATLLGILRSRSKDERSSRRMTRCAGWAVALVTAVTVAGSGSPALANELPRQPRIVNIYNFIRNSDYRVKDSEDVLFEATKNQIALIKPTGMPVTWALQYDALINPKYQKLLKEKIGKQDEIAAWWEIPRPLAEKAGLKWRGHDHEWDSTANVGFSPGYTPEERRKLVDVYMAEFKSVFGYYPLTVGSWFIDEITLDYMVERYGIVASCNCKDQVGTDGYTLWGGYWNQAYYPSKLNSYMPAQTKAGQIDIPVFRMLGSDPIYQYGTKHHISSLEPVYGESGGSEKWVKWFLKNMIERPSLGFAYTQAGQENSFGWDSMKNGLKMQVKLLSAGVKSGDLQVMTLADSGRWFKKKYPLTPPTSMTYLDDWKEEGRRSVWYNSRFYRANFLWQDGGLLIRDIHRFDESVKAVTHDSALTTNTLAYTALPVMDSDTWSGPGPVGIFPVLLEKNGETSPMVPDGEPVVTELNATDLSIVQKLAGGGKLSIICQESQLAFSGEDAQGKPMAWAWDMKAGDGFATAVTSASDSLISFRSRDLEYNVTLSKGFGTCERKEGAVVRLLPNAKGRLVMGLGNP